MNPILIKGLFKRFDDDRGFLAAINFNSFKQAGINNEFIYKLSSFTEKQNTFRGLHFQHPPFEQAKLLFLVSGKIRDFCLRVSDGKVYEFILNPGDCLYIPETFAHGFLTMTDNVLLEYLLDDIYSAEHYSGYNFKSIKSLSSLHNLNISQQDSDLELY